MDVIATFILYLDALMCIMRYIVFNLKNTNLNFYSNIKFNAMLLIIYYSFIVSVCILRIIVLDKAVT